MKSKGYAIIVTVALLTGACSSSKTDENQVSADRIEAAHNAGREAAREFVSKKWTDSLELQQQLVEAGVQAAAFDSVPRLREAFDSAFISTVRTVRPEVADELDRYRKQNPR